MQLRKFIGLVVIAMAMLGCRRRAPRLKAQAPAWLERAAYEQLAKHAPHSLPLGPAFRGAAVREDGRRRFTVTFDKGQCYVISAVADRAVAGELYVNLWDASNDRVAKNKNGTPNVLLDHCAKQQGTYSFELKVTRGNGHFLALVYRRVAEGKRAPSPQDVGPVPSNQPSPPPAVLAPLSDEELETRIAQQVAAVAPEAERIGGYYRGRGAQSDWYPTLENTKCYWFVVAASVPQRAVTLSLSSPAGKPLANQRADSSPTSLRYCPAVGAMYHFRVAVEDATARYKAAVFAERR